MTTTTTTTTTTPAKKKIPLSELTAGMDVDAYCTKCKLDLNHRVVAMAKEKPKKVECQTCKGEHNYRLPMAERAAKAKATRARKAAIAKVVNTRAEWERALRGRTKEDFTKYAMSVELTPDQCIQHKKFGEGVVMETNDGKASVLFVDGLKTLIHGRTG